MAAPAEKKKIRIRRAKGFDVVEMTMLLTEGALVQGRDVWYPQPSSSETKKLAHVLALIDQGLVVVAETDEQIVGAIGMTICQDDWSDQWKVVNEWLYIDEKFRNANVDDALLTFVEAWADDQVNPDTQEGLPVIMAIISGKDVEVKDELMKRRGYQYAGGNFVRPPHVQVQKDDIDEQDPDLAGTG